MKMKQAQLRVMISEEVSHMTDRVITTPPPPSQVSSSCLATDIQPWSHHIPPTGPAPHIYSYDRYHSIYVYVVVYILLINMFCV